MPRDQQRCTDEMDGRPNSVDATITRSSDTSQSSHMGADLQTTHSPGLAVEGLGTCGSSGSGSFGQGQVAGVQVLFPAEVAGKQSKAEAHTCCLPRQTLRLSLTLSDLRQKPIEREGLGWSLPWAVCSGEKLRWFMDGPALPVESGKCPVFLLGRSQALQ